MMCGPDTCYGFKYSTLLHTKAWYLSREGQRATIHRVLSCAPLAQEDVSYLLKNEEQYLNASVNRWQTASHDQFKEEYLSSAGSISIRCIVPETIQVIQKLRSQPGLFQTILPKSHDDPTFFCQLGTFLLPLCFLLIAN